MKANLADIIHPIFNHGISLRDRLDAEEPLDRARERSTLKDRLAVLGAEQSSLLDLDEPLVFDFFSQGNHDDLSRLTRATVRYALTVWLDEFLGRLPERTLEAELYGTTEGNAKFWEEARNAEARGDLDALEVMHLCAALGFRGAWRDQPEQLERWSTRVRCLLEQLADGWAMPASLEPLARDRAQPGNGRVAFSLVLTFALALPLALVLLWRNW